MIPGDNSPSWKPREEKALLPIRISMMRNKGEKSTNVTAKRLEDSSPPTASKDQSDQSDPLHLFGQAALERSLPKDSAVKGKVQMSHMGYVCTLMSGLGSMVACFITHPSCVVRIAVIQIKFKGTYTAIPF